MDREQTYDTVDTPPKDRSYLPALEEFEEQERIDKWRNIQHGVYKLHKIQVRGANKYGPSVVLKLEHENGSTMLVWAPASLAYALQNRKSTDYILNLGMRRSEERGIIAELRRPKAAKRSPIPILGN